MLQNSLSHTATSYTPVFLSWIANIATLLIHIVDPRYSSLVLILCVIIFTMIFISLFFKSIVKCYSKDPNYCMSIMLINFTGLLFLLSWYAMLTQHSFDHATYTYRSLVVWLGGLVGTFVHLKTTQRLIPSRKY